MSCVHRTRREHWPGREARPRIDLDDTAVFPWQRVAAPPTFMTAVPVAAGDGVHGPWTFIGGLETDPGVWVHPCVTAAVTCVTLVVLFF